MEILLSKKIIDKMRMSREKFGKIFQEAEDLNFLRTWETNYLKVFLRICQESS